MSICVAWAYSITIGLPLVVLKSDGNLELHSKVSCYFNKVASSTWRISIIIVTILINLIQVSTYNSLKKRLSGATNLHLSIGKIKMYKRAMTTCGLIAVAYSIGWLPIAVGSLMFDWMPGYRGVIIEVNSYSRILFILQGFSNAVIFGLRNVTCHCKRNSNKVHPGHSTLLTIVARPKENGSNPGSIFNATPPDQ